jgi:hypothetical protein
MRIFPATIHSILLVITPTLLAHPIAPTPKFVNHTANHEPFQIPDLQTLSYDEVVDLLEKIESDSFIDNCSTEDLDQINRFISFLAIEGANDDEKVDMENATASLFRKNDFQYGTLKNSNFSYTLMPTIYMKGDYEIILCKSWFKKQWDQTRKFVKEHKKEIIIGAIVVVTIAVVVVAAVAISSAAAGTAAASAVASAQSASQSNSPKNGDNNQSTELSSIEPLTESLQEQVAIFKETVAKEQFAAAPESNGISIEENGRIIGSLFAHKTLDNVAAYLNENRLSSTDVNHLSTPKWAHYPQNATSSLHAFPDSLFSTDYTTASFQNFDNLNDLSYQIRGNLALSTENYLQAVQDFGKAISLSPNNPTLYLERGIAHFELGNYENSLSDYSQFVEKTGEPFSVTDFSLGFARGVPKGVCESGKDGLIFLSDFITHPIHTSKQIASSLTQLVLLVKNDEYGVVAKCLSPELHELVTNWDTLPSVTRGELAGYAIGKIGTDLLAPGAVAKIAAKSITSAKELVAICKNLQLAQDILILETASGIGIPAKISEVMEMSKKAATLGEELGIINNEIRFSIRNLTSIQERNFLSSAAKPYDQNLTLLAHAFSKHAGRHPEIWGRLIGPMNTWHEQAVNQLKYICNASGEFHKVFDAKTGLTWIEKRLPDGRGVRLNQDYTFKGFVD